MSSDDNDPEFFSMIFDGSVAEEDRVRRRVRSHVIVPPALRRKKKKKSKYYTRPIFKEPGSKINNDIAEHNDMSEHEKREEQKKPDPRLTIVGELRDEVQKMTFLSKNEDNTVIQPSSRTHHRLQSLVGKPKDAKVLSPSSRNRTLYNRLLKEDGPVNKIDSSVDSSASVLTCTNLDNLASRRLQAHKFERQSSDLSVIRREVKQMVGVVLPNDDDSVYTTETSKLTQSVDDIMKKRPSRAQGPTVKIGSIKERSAYIKFAKEAKSRPVEAFRSPVVVAGKTKKEMDEDVDRGVDKGADEGVDDVPERRCNESSSTQPGTDIRDDSSIPLQNEESDTFFQWPDFSGFKLF